MYCVYLTTYFGNKLPPFYIGSASIDRINKGYHGTVSSKRYKSIWAKELADNPQLFSTRIICQFVSRKDALEKEKKLQMLLSAVQNGLYINQAYACPNGFFGRDVKGENNPMYGKSLSDKSKGRISSAHTGKLLTDSHKDNIKRYQQQYWSSENSKQHRKYRSEKISGEGNPMYGKFGKDNPNFGSKRTENSRQKISEALIGNKKNEQHRKKMCRVYEIKRETGETFIGYGLGDFCDALGFNQSSLLYTLTSGKFFKGFKILRKLDGESIETPLSSFI